MLSFYSTTYMYKKTYMIIAMSNRAFFKGVKASWFTYIAEKVLSIELKNNHGIESGKQNRALTSSRYIAEMKYDWN